MIGSVAPLGLKPEKKEGGGGFDCNHGLAPRGYYQTPLRG
jgi:hypothetical protein